MDVVPTVPTMAIGSNARLSVLRDRLLQSVRPHLEALVRRDLREAGASQAEGHAGLLDRRVGLRRGVYPELRHVHAPRQPLRRSIDTRRLACRREGQQRRSRGRVGQQAVEFRRQAQALAQPVDDHHLQLRAGRAGPPQHRVRVQNGRQHLPDDARPGGGAAEIGQEPRVLPVSDVGLEETAVVIEDRLDRLGLLGWQRREERAQRARLYLRHYGPLPHPAQVVGHDVYRGVGGRAEVLDVHVAHAGALLGVQLGHLSGLVRFPRASRNHSSLVPAQPDPAAHASLGSGPSLPRVDGVRPKRPWRAHNGQGAAIGAQSLARSIREIRSEERTR